MIYTQCPADNSTLQELAERINMTERTLARYSQKSWECLYMNGGND